MWNYSGYNDILLIPAGATNIVVEETAPSNNYLAIRNTSGHYYLNGNWRIDFPRSIDFAGSKFHYERYPQGFAAPDKIYTLGPIDEPLFIVVCLSFDFVLLKQTFSRLISVTLPRCNRSSRIQVQFAYQRSTWFWVWNVCLDFWWIHSLYGYMWGR